MAANPQPTISKSLASRATPTTNTVSETTINDARRTLAMRVRVLMKAPSRSALESISGFTLIPCETSVSAFDWLFA